MNTKDCVAKMEITKVQILIRSFLFETKDVINDPKKAQEWLIKFRDTLNYQSYEKEPSQYAISLLNEAASFGNKQKQNQMMRWAKNDLIQAGIKEPTREQIIQKCAEKYKDEFGPQIKQGTKTTTPPKPRNQPKEPHQPTKDELYLFADTEHLDVADAREWYEINYVERPGCDKNGEVIKNWKGHCKRYCQAKLNKRNQENEK